METFPVQGAPNIYRCHDGALYELKEAIYRQRFKQGLLVHGLESWQVAERFIEPLELPVEKIAYNGECTKEEVERLIEIVQTNDLEFVVAVGGGKIIDLAKSVGNQLNIPFLVVPTLASNCAAWTPLSVFYDVSGQFIGYEVYDNNAWFVAIEPELILDSPTAYFRAGIGDTLAKWYEAEALIAPLEKRPVAVDIAYQTAKLSKDVLIEEGTQALADQQSNQASDAFIRVSETIIMVGGMVGGFGERYGRIAGAHTIHNALTTLDETHDHLHGDKVAYGILVQLALVGAHDEVNRLMPYYKELGLPVCLADLGVTDQFDSAVDRVARAALKPGESIHFIGSFTHEALKETMLTLETSSQGE
ncbi:uncharacterized oxidoreductase [Pelagirhabdus alkalitolerans]|uniref:Uncharacterized oxidoreductase n=1 Tax=Pelagirhabdus alkalitolerans TaxID=1612202 RepID=A0A1G6GMB7_9BACI|nr:iron-containing alcohol dehydrogenase family protein [Pelagirhabdus alkalitolerans]SDB83107.1 uncharacterized oxidoreductase [Pelagirhabdus alkalitolerans]